mmetsp:Transcript_2177/g.3065  ORF Transcript_2177/g.3065 Transcript_2177/m.3065 type:complete len:248 (+) Transcript_2177:1-744(+)
MTNSCFILSSDNKVTISNIINKIKKFATSKKINCIAINASIHLQKDKHLEFDLDINNYFNILYIQKFFKFSIAYLNNLILEFFFIIIESFLFKVQEKENLLMIVVFPLNWMALPNSTDKKTFFAYVNKTFRIFYFLLIKEEFFNIDFKKIYFLLIKILLFLEDEPNYLIIIPSHFNNVSYNTLLNHNKQTIIFWKQFCNVINKANGSLFEMFIIHNIINTIKKLEKVVFSDLNQAYLTNLIGLKIEQ